MIGIILSMTEQGGIGFQQTIPWHLNKQIRKEDLSLFKAFTKDKAVIMGRNTWLSLPTKPLPGRVNIVLSNNLKDDEVNCYSNSYLSKVTLEQTLTHWKNYERVIIGGAKLYNYALTTDFIDYVMVYVVPGSYKCDAFVDLNLLEAFENQSTTSNMHSSIGSNIILMTKKTEDVSEEACISEEKELNPQPTNPKAYIYNDSDISFHEGINLAINFFGNGLNTEQKQALHNQILNYGKRVHGRKQQNRPC